MLKSCEKTCQLLSQQADRHLKWYEKLQLKLHLSMCYGCRRYSRQIDGIEAGMKQLRQQHSHSFLKLKQSKNAITKNQHQS